MRTIHRARRALSLVRLATLLLAALLLAGCFSSTPPPAGDGSDDNGTQTTPPTPTATPDASRGWDPSQGGVPPWWEGYARDPENQTVTLATTAQPGDGVVIIRAVATNVGARMVNVTDFMSCGAPGIVLSWVTPSGEDTYEQRGLCASAFTDSYSPDATPLAPGTSMEAEHVFRGRIQYHPQAESFEAKAGNHTMTAHVCWTLDNGTDWPDGGCASRFVTFAWDPAMAADASR